MEIEVVVRPRMRKTARRATKSKKPKIIPLSRLKKQLEALQKQIVIKFYGTDCYTCPAKSLSGANCQLGHVPWPRTDLSTQAKFDYRFTRIQCFRCNIHLGGAGAKAFQRMIEEGINVQALRVWSDEQKGKVVPRKWFEDTITHYQSLI